jgi:muramoyltetrapeptide carboxypeptidase
MVTPRYLKPGDTVAIVAPARKVSPSEMEPAIRLLKSWGLQVITGQHLFGACNQYSGTDEERASDLQMMLDDPGVSAIFAARGGYGTVRIIDQLDFTAFCRRPKWIVGFSDVTVMHAHIHSQFGIETLHAAMPFTFPKDGLENATTLSLKKALFGESLEYKLPTSEFSKAGNCEGILIGGNLSILYAINGTSSDIATNGKVLFIEDLDEYLYHIDRMMLNLKRTGMLSGLAGMIIGGMSKMNDNTIPFGKTAEEIIREAIAEYSFPVYFGFPAGHCDDNRALIMGRKISLAVTVAETRMVFMASESESGIKNLLRRILKPALIFLAFLIIIYLLYCFLLPTFQ